MGSPAGLGSSGPGASRAAKTAKRHLRYEVAFVLVYKGERDAIAAIAKAQAHARGERSHALRASTLSWCSSPVPSRRAWRPFRSHRATLMPLSQLGVADQPLTSGVRASGRARKARSASCALGPAPAVCRARQQPLAEHVDEERSAQNGATAIAVAS